MPNRKHLLCNFFAAALLLFSATFNTNLQAQCTSTGARSAGNFSSVTFSGSEFGFSNLTNVLTSDDVRSSASALLTLFNGETEYLQATNFGFSIPMTAVVCGIEVEVEKHATGIGSILGIGLSYVTDYSVRLVRTGSVAGQDKAKAGNWTTSEAYHTYGGSSDLWGIGWTPTDINASDFGVAVSARIGGLTMLLPSVHIDHIRITVHYYEVLLSQNLLELRATPTKNNAALIEWKTAGDLSGYQQVQRSQNGVQWEAVPGTPAVVSAGNMHWYQLTDHLPYAGTTYYRLAITEPSGTRSYSALRSIYMDNRLRTNVYPNPFGEYLVVSGVARGERIVLRDAYGKTIAASPVRTGGDAYRFDVRPLPPGIYIVQAGNTATKVVKQ